MTEKKRIFLQFVYLCLLPTTEDRLGWR